MRWKQKNTSNSNKLSFKTQTLSLGFWETSIFYVHNLKGFWDTIYFSRKIKTTIHKNSKRYTQEHLHVQVHMPPKGFFILKFGKLSQYFFMKSNFWTIKTVFILVKLSMYLHTLHQATSRLLPNGSLIARGSGLQFTYGRPKFETRSLNRCIKIMIASL